MGNNRMEETPYNVLIVPLWNWNAYAGDNRRRSLRFNRTFMELKLTGFDCIFAPLRSFNRTFMELKYTLIVAAKGRIAVLIVPLWNWNVRGLAAPLSRKNVLIVPLWNWNCNHFQRSSHWTGVLIVPLWNWNYFLRVRCRNSLSFNRTFMELKCTKGGKVAAPQLVLIVPLWNWNDWTKRKVFKKAGFNRTFMELKSFLDKTNTNMYSF